MRENLPAVSPPKFATTGLGLIKKNHNKFIINIAYLLVGSKVFFFPIFFFTNSQAAKMVKVLQTW